jgi:hypothetical protein
MTLATVTPLPVRRRRSTPWRPASQRKILLAWLAASAAEGRPVPASIREDLLTLYADPSKPAAQTRENWREYLQCVRQQDEIAHGALVAWQDLDDEMAPDGRHMPVEEIAANNAATALTDLVGRDH